MRLKDVNISPRTIEAIAVGFAIVVLIVGIWAFCKIPPAEFTRKEIIKLTGAIVGSLGVASLLLVWAQLRHTATLNRLLSYHQYFHDLPNTTKVRDLYKALLRCKINVPTWNLPLSESERDTLLKDTEPLPENAVQVAREYLNDFEEFAAAVNCGLIDEDYAYRLEATRSLNAYYGFREVIIHWLAEDCRRAERAGNSLPLTTNYYGELRSVVERWRLRKEAAAAKEQKKQEKDRISERLLDTSLGYMEFG
jgi:hypothetical protein